MKKLLVIAMVALMASAAVAQEDGTANSFGLYFDAALTNTTGTIAVGAPTQIHMATFNPTVVGCATLEIAFKFKPDGAFIFAGDPAVVWNGTAAVDVDSSPFGFIAGFGTPIMATGNYIYFGYMNVTAFSAVSGAIAGPVATPSVPGEAVMVDAADFGHLVPLEFATDVDGMCRDATGWLLAEAPCMMLSTGAVSAQDATWSQVKGLFR